MDQTQTDNQDLAQGHAHQISAAIDRLRELNQTTGQNGHRAFWIHSRHVLDLFKTLRPLNPEDRQNLWAAYQDLCAYAHERQTAQRKELQAASRALREQIETDMTEADRLLNGDPAEGDITSAMEILRSALQKMKTGVAVTSPTGPAVPQQAELEETQATDSDSMYQAGSPATVENSAENTGIHFRLLREDREECWRQWRVVRQRAQVHMDDKFGGILTAAHAMATRAQTENPPQVLSAIRDLQAQAGRLGLPRERREQIRQALNAAWKTAVARLQQMREERKAKFQEWRERMDSNLKRWHDQVAGREQTIAHLREQIDRLKSMQSHARNEEHRARVQEWIDETTEKLQKHEAAVLDIRGKISSVQAKLRR